MSAKKALAERDSQDRINLSLEQSRAIIRCAIAAIQSLASKAPMVDPYDIIAALEAAHQLTAIAANTAHETINREAA